MRPADSEVPRRGSDTYINMIRQCTKQLYQEYDQILYSYRLKLSPVIIEITPLANKWGDWNPNTRHIRLSDDLVLRYEWDIVCEILKHEMAHQLADQTSVDTQPHGPAFQRACEKLGVATWARRASLQPQNGIERKGSTLCPETARVTRRVEKLMALSNSSNEHEAMSAMRKVQKLMLDHNVTPRENDESSYETATIDLKKKRIERPITVIASILAEHYFVRVIYSYRYDAYRNETYKTIELLGKQHNVEMAEYIFHFLRRSIASTWQQHRKDNKTPATQRVSFQLGMLSGFDKVLRSTTTKSSKNSDNRQSLIRMSEQALDLYVRERYPRLHSRTSGSGLSLHSDAYQHGAEEGRRLRITPPVRGSSQQRPLQIGS